MILKISDYAGTMFGTYLKTPVDPIWKKKKNTFRKYSKKMLNVFVEYKFSRCYL